ncbi:DUF6049 family protein [Microbacterium sp. Root166]|uniref:DUF6049 family protein n=1 Tax=Microbacterium sp. Root166 TaxID=1736478 RepID=UPI0012F9DDB5|nr:DUF6049 family protein [Microbacterium sp. Root166]
MTTSRSPARRRATRAAAVAAATLALVGTLLAPAAAIGAAPSPTPTPTPTPPITSGTTAFTLSPISDGIVRPGEPLTVSLTLQNETDAPTPPITATIALGRTELPDRAALTAWLSGDTGRVTAEPVATAAIESVAPGGQAVTPARIDPSSPALAGLEPGVYPLVATYESATGPVTSTSAMIVPPSDDDAVGIGVVVPITAQPLTEGLLTAEQLTELTSPGGSLTSQLDGVDGTSAILAIDPAIPASIRVLGGTAPESAVAWLTRLETLANSRFALQFGDADVAVQIEAGLERPLAPPSLLAYMDPAEFIPETAATPTPTPEPGVDPAAPVFPERAELLDIGPATRGAVFWPAAGTADAPVVEALGAVTSGDQRSLTLVASTETAAGATGGTVPAHARAGEAELLVYDAAVSAALHRASGLEETSLRGAALTEATAYLAFATAETGGAPLLVTLGRDPARSRVALGTTIESVTSAPNVSASTLGALANTGAVDLEVAGGTSEQTRVDAATALIAEETEVSRFATILDEPRMLTGPQRAEILQLLGVGWIPTPEPWTDAVVGHRAATQVTLDSVSLLPTSTIDLYGSNAGLRFWVRNDLEYPVNLVLYVTPDDLRLDVQRANPVVAQAESNTRVEVPVQARVGNGEVTLDLQLRSRASVAIGDPASVDVTVRAEWETFGITALGVVIGGLLLLGIVRTVLKLRARRRGRAASRDAGAASGTTGDDGKETLT